MKSELRIFFIFNFVEFRKIGYWIVILEKILNFRKQEIEWEKFIITKVEFKLTMW